MGTDKAWIEVRGEPLVRRQVTRLKEAFDDVRVSAREPGRFAAAGFPTVVDSAAEAAPIHGVRAALAAVGRPVFVLAVDLPDFPAVLAAAIARELLARRAAAAVPAAGGILQGLCAAWAPEVLPIIDRNVTAGRLAIRDLVAECRAAVLEEGFWGRYAGPEAFTNWNRPEDHDARKDDRNDPPDAPGRAAAERGDDDADGR